MANEYCSFWLLQKYETRDNQTIPVYPNVWSIDGDGTEDPIIRKCNDTACGYDPRPEVQYRWVNLDPTMDYYCDDCPEAQYRWVDMNPSTDYYCEGTTKYYKQKKQVSVDGGQTWEDVVPAEYQRGSVYETESTDCGYVPPTPTSQYFTLVAKSNGVLVFNGNTTSNMQKWYYSRDNGENWTIGNNQGFTGFTVTSGDKIMFKGNLRTVNGCCNVSASTGTQFEAEGNVMSLIYDDNFKGEKSLYGKSEAFKQIFINCSGLTSIDNLVLPATVLADNCYDGMFAGCTSLTSVTSGLLPATTLASYCYYGMFSGCTSLTTAPILSASTLANRCYSHMFDDCTSLTTPPVLSADTLADNCYYGMFVGCTSLTTAPVLSANTLAQYCYAFMFGKCTSLTTPPVLSASTLASHCYFGMFSGCTSLTTAPILSASTLTTGCYACMFGECTSLTTPPVLSSTTIADSCYYQMFYGCSGLTSVPDLPATTLAPSCYSEMFSGCHSLTTVPNNLLPATTMEAYCYEGMFAYCSKLTTAPILPATILVEDCYEEMFRSCSHVNNITCLATSLYDGSICTYYWVERVSSSGTFYKNPNMRTWSRGASGIPTGWTVVDYNP